ncbi:type IV toxin-antitoxin system AbiEi family antitoxin [Acidobacteriota bacterium]
MNKMMKEQEIIYLALDSLKRKYPEIQVHIDKNHIEVAFDNKKMEFEIVVKKDLSGINSLHSLVKIFPLGGEREKRVVISQHISNEIAYLLKEKKINFLDTHGNAYIQTDNVFIFTMDKHRVRKAADTRVRRTFYSSGLKLIFSLLNSPELINENYRHLSKVSGVSLGSIGWILKDLKEMNYLLLRDKNKKKLINKEKLLEKWIEDYADRLRPNLLKGHYRFAKDEIKKNRISAIDEFKGTFWGSEIAAELCTGYLKAERFTLYTTDNIIDIIRKLKLIHDPNGPVEVLNVFWDTESGYYKCPNPQLPGKKVVPVILIYADLVISGDARNLEAAKVLYEKHLQNLLQ